MKKRSEDMVLIPIEFEPKDKDKYYYAQVFGAFLGVGSGIWMLLNLIRLIMGDNQVLQQLLLGAVGFIGGPLIAVLCEAIESDKTYVNYIKYLQKSNKELKRDNKLLRKACNDNKE